MKLKIITSAFFIITLFSYSNWKILEVVDEFQDKTGRRAIENKIFETRKIRLDLEGEINSFVLNMIVPGVLKGGEKKILVKIDDREPLSFKGEIIASEDGILNIKIPQSYGFFDLSKNKNNFKILLREMNQGKILKIQFFNDRNESVIERFDLADFSQVYPELIKKN